MIELQISFTRIFPLIERRMRQNWFTPFSTSFSLAFAFASSPPYSNSSRPVRIGDLLWSTSEYRCLWGGIHSVFADPFFIPLFLSTLAVPRTCSDSSSNGSWSYDLSRCFQQWVVCTSKKKKKNFYLSWSRRHLRKEKEIDWHSTFVFCWLSTADTSPLFSLHDQPPLDLDTGSYFKGVERPTTNSTSALVRRRGLARRRLKRRNPIPPGVIRLLWIHGARWWLPLMKRKG